MCQKWEGDCGLWAPNEIIFKNMLKVWKKLWEPFGSCLLNSTANPPKLWCKWAGLAVLFSRQLPNSSHDFFQTFSICFFLIISLRTHKPQLPSHFWHIISQLQVVCKMSENFCTLSTVALWTFKVMEVVPEDHMLLFFCIDYTIWPGAVLNRVLNLLEFKIWKIILLRYAECPSDMETRSNSFSIFKTTYRKVASTNMRY